MAAATALAAAASVWVAFEAFTSSRTARRIAPESEAAAVRDEGGGGHASTSFGFEDALANFLEDVGRQLETLRAAISAHHTKSSRAPLIASLEVVRLRARGKDIEAMDVVRRVFKTAWDTLDLRERESILRALPREVREWRTGELSLVDFAAWADELTSAVGSPTEGGLSFAQPPASEPDDTPLAAMPDVCVKLDFSRGTSHPARPIPSPASPGGCTAVRP